MPKIEILTLLFMLQKMRMCFKMAIIRDSKKISLKLSNKKR